MQEPFEPTPQTPADRELVAAPEMPMPEAPLPRPARPGAEAPMREVAHAFRMNAEALHTLKEMQADLARQVRRGDRSELVLQSTQALNETFRNLTAVQQELLRRIHVGEQRKSGGPLVPLMLLGLLVVFLGCTWVVLDQLDKQRAPGAAGSGIPAADIVRRERDAWKEGRSEGARHADNELKRLNDALDEAKSRARTLQAEIDTRAEKLADIDQARRTAELERDEFAGQVRKAQSEMMAKKALEDEIAALKVQLDAANRSASTAEHERNLQRSQNAWLRERMADYGMGFDESDPPWRPGRDAGATPEGMPPIGPTAEDAGYSKLTNLDIARRKLDAMHPDAPSARTGSASDAADPAPVTGPARGPVTAPGTDPAAAPAGSGRRRAAYGGDAPGMPPPAILRARGGVDADTTSVERVRQHLNGLLRSGDARAGAGWRITSLREVDADRLGGVVMVRYDAGGRMVESVEAREVRIAHDRGRKQVEFAFRDGDRMISGQRLALPSIGSRVVVAEGQGADAWSGSSLRVIQKK